MDGDHSHLMYEEEHGEGIMSNITWVYIHPNFTDSGLLGYENDIALLVLVCSLPMNNLNVAGFSSWNSVNSFVFNFVCLKAVNMREGPQQIV